MILPNNWHARQQMKKVRWSPILRKVESYSFSRSCSTCVSTFASATGGSLCASVRAALSNSGFTVWHALHLQWIALSEYEYLLKYHSTAVSCRHFDTLHQEIPIEFQEKSKMKNWMSECRSEPGLIEENERYLVFFDRLTEVPVCVSCVTCDWKGSPSPVSSSKQLLSRLTEKIQRQIIKRITFKFSKILP